MLGESINGYKITKKLGEGAMGEVWMAEKQIESTSEPLIADNIKVAIKFLLKKWFTDKVIVHRFFDEARAVIRIKHAGVAKIYDVGMHRDSPYLIMELLEGETLADRLKRLGRLPLGHIGEVGAQIASALEATHAAKIIHRDLKPENIFLVHDEEPRSRERAKILDFGIAKLGSEAGRTMGNHPLGTPGYMSPELWRGAAHAGAPADVYAFGCIAFQICCGRPPFEVHSIAEACGKHTYGQPPRLRSLAPEVSADIDAIVARALAKDPAERPTASELVHAFAAFSIVIAPPSPPMPMPIELAPTDPILTPPGPPVHAIPTIPPTSATPRRLWHRSLITAIVAGSIVGVGGGVLVLTRPGAHPPALAPVDNAWVRVQVPEAPVVLGIHGGEGAAHGFQSARHIVSPARPYELQEHEVTWSEIEPWLAATHTALPVPLPAWAKDPDARRSLPVTGVTWEIAERYCESLGHDARLPTEEEWEYAARGVELRPHSWGSERLDRKRTHVYLGATAAPAPVKTSTQDRTPDLRFYDLDGNVQEWTLALWRQDVPDADESAATIGKDTTLRSLRGLPLDEDPPAVMQDETAAYHERWCATGPCVRKTLAKLLYVGLRCAQAVR